MSFSIVLFSLFLVSQHALAETHGVSSKEHTIGGTAVTISEFQNAAKELKSRRDERLDYLYEAPHALSRLRSENLDLEKLSSVVGKIGHFDCLARIRRYRLGGIPPTESFESSRYLRFEGELRLERDSGDRSRFIVLFGNDAGLLGEGLHPSGARVVGQAPRVSSFYTITGSVENDVTNYSFELLTIGRNGDRYGLRVWAERRHANSKVVTTITCLQEIK